VEGQERREKNPHAENQPENPDRHVYWFSGLSLNQFQQAEKDPRYPIYEVAEQAPSKKHR